MSINKIILQILNNRGILGEKNIEEFLSPRPLTTYDPFLLLNMKEGVDLILNAIETNKKICIYGDYDADGVTSVSVLMEVLKHLTDNLMYYVPSRFSEGYGLNKEAIDYIHSMGVDLIVTVDCGIVSFDEVDYAKKSGMEIIVTDHHSVEERLPDCTVINPKQPNCPYPFKELAGCGVAFKLAQAIQRKTNLPKGVINRVLDLVALGTVGDVMPLIDENRTMVKYGIWEIEKGNRRGLKMLTDRILKDGTNISSDDISYGIVPYLNAVGRMEDASIGIDLLTENTYFDKEELVNKMIELNNLRKKVQEELYTRCVDIYERECSDYSFPIVYMNDAHEGITGIVAGKMKDYSGKPFVIVTENEGLLKGTGRSVDNVDIYEILKGAKDLFEKFGGHKGACGFTLKKDNLDILRDHVNKTMSIVEKSDTEPCVAYDMQLKGEDISLDLAKEIDTMEPFGNGNQKPIFVFENCLIKNLFYIGDNNQHIKFKIDMDGFNNLDCICFNYRDLSDTVSEGSLVKIIGGLDVNRWYGRENLQLIVKAILS